MEILREYNEPIATRLNESLVLSKQLSGILTQGLNGNPRQCKRFLNTLDMRQKMAKYKNVTLKSSVLAKIMEVEYFQTSLFRKMINLLGDNMLQTELEGFEKEQEEKINALAPWRNELWVKKWMKTKPMLSEEKLENYFYSTLTPVFKNLTHIIFTNILIAKYIIAASDTIVFIILTSCIVLEVNSDIISLLKTPLINIAITAKF